MSLFAAFLSCKIPSLSVHESDSLLMGRTAEGVPAGNVLFAGEHANSFYEWQGFMEGATLSGIAAAQSILITANRR